MADMGASVLARLKNKAAETGRSNQLCLQLFCQEEFLRRLEKSRYAENLVLKGGLFLYTKYKDLHLYVAETAVDLQKLSCSTYFSFEGRMPLEVDGYKLVAPDNYGIYFRSLGPLVKICMERYREYKKNAAGRQV